MNVYDCFQFFDENMMLDLRLNILDKHIHKFVIVESKYMHNGKEKKLVFNINNFAKFKDKIIYVVVDSLPKGLCNTENIQDEDEWGNKIIDNTLLIEHTQRNSLVKGLTEANDDDLIIVSDVDEIPNLEVKDLKNNKKKLIQFKQSIYYYKFNLKYSSMQWFGSKACLKKNFVSPQWLRDTKERKYPLWRLDILFSKMKYNSIHHVENGGWHFTNIKSPDDIFKKLKNYGHHLEFNESGLSLNDIKNMVLNKRAVYDFHVDMRSNKWTGKQKLYKCDLSELPEYLLQNKEKYALWMD